MRTVFDVMRDRRSQKLFTPHPVTDDQINQLLDVAVLAPNHRMTQPWSFAVLGPGARRRYGQIKAALRVAQETDPAIAEAKRTKIAVELAAIPAVIVVLQREDADPERAKEDYAAIFMGIENMLLAATALDLGSKVHTGEIMRTAALRELVRADDNEQIVAIVHVGEPAEPMKPKPRIPAPERTRWIP